MRQVDEVLADRELVQIAYEALARRWPQSRTRGRAGTPAEVVLRLLLLKHMRNWSYCVLEPEVRVINDWSPSRAARPETGAMLRAYWTAIAVKTI